MNSLSKVIVLFAILGILGAGLFFYPGSPLHYTRIIVVQQENGEAEAVQTSEPASGEVEMEMEMNPETEMRE